MFTNLNQRVGTGLTVFSHPSTSNVFELTPGFVSNLVNHRTHQPIRRQLRR
jgi:hypothetical protein